MISTFGRIGSPCLSRHCEERSDAAIQKAAREDWIASSQELLAMTADMYGALMERHS